MSAPEVHSVATTATSFFAKEGLVSNATYLLTFLAILLIILKEIAGIVKFGFHAYKDAVFALDNFKAERERRQKAQTKEKETPVIPHTPRSGAPPGPAPPEGEGVDGHRHESDRDRRAS